MSNKIAKSNDINNPTVPTQILTIQSEQSQNKDCPNEPDDRISPNDINWMQVDTTIV